MADSDIVGSASLRINVDTSGVEGQILTGARAAAAKAEARLAQQQERSSVRLGQLQARADRENAQRTATAVKNAERQVAANARVTKSLEDQQITASRVAGVFSAVVAGAFALSVRRAVELRSEFERSQVAFRGLLAESAAVQGGLETTAQAVQGLTADLQILSIRSGADIGELARGTQALITGLDLSRSAAVGLVEDIAAAAAASGASLDAIPRAIRAITQISSKGFLSAEELNQIADVLPVVSRTDIYENLAEALKLPIAEIQKLANEGGRITSAQGLPALIKVLREVEGSAEALDRQLATLPGALNVLRQTARITAQEGFGEASVAIRGFVNDLGGITGVREVFDDLFEPFNQLSADVIRALGQSFIAAAPAIAEFAGEFAELFGAAIGLAPTLTDIAVIFLKIATVSLSLLNALGPLRGILVSLIAAFIAFSSVQTAIVLIQRFTAALVTLRTTSLATAGALGTLRAVAGPLAAVVTLVAGAISFLGGNAKSTGDRVAEFNDELARTGDIATALRGLTGVDLDAFAQDIQGLATGVSALTGAEAVDVSGLDEVKDVLAGFTGIVNANQFATARAIIADERLAVVRTQLTKILEDGERAFIRKTKATQRERDAIEELVNPTQAAETALRQFNEALKESTSQIQNVISADERLTDARQRVRDAIDNVHDAEKALADLRAELSTSAAEDLVELEERRLELLEELAQAEDDVTQAERGVESARRGVEDATDAVADADERLIDAQEALNELFEPATERELAEARRGLQRAENALADATERRVEAEQALAALERRKQNQGGRLSVIGLDNLRINLANARASAAAQRTVPDEEALRDDLADAILDEAEAKERVVDATEELNELEREGLPTAEAVAEARREVGKAERDVERARVDQGQATEDLARAEQDLVESQVALTEARDIEAGLEPTRQQQLKDRRDLENQIADASERIDAAQRSVTDARTQAALAENAQIAALRLLNGEQDAEVQNLNDLVRLYGELGILAPETLRAIRAEAFGFSPEALAANQLLDALSAALEIVPSAGGLVLRPRSGLGALLGQFSAFEHGGLITQPTMAMMGERGLKELVLPLTKPARAIQLAQQHGFIDMLSRNNQAMFPSTTLSRPAPTPTLTRSGGSAPAHDPLIAEIRTLNSLLAQGSLSEDIDININAPLDENGRLRARQMARQVEKAIKRAKHGR